MIPALTLHQPMGWAIVVPHERRKTIENRPRPLPKTMTETGTYVAVHSGLKWSPEYAETCKRIIGIEPPRYTQSCLLGVMHLTGRQFTSTETCLSDWFSGPFGYEIDASWTCAPHPTVLCSGAQGWWRVPSDKWLQLRARVPLDVATACDRQIARAR